jgi:hypothetical protein
VRDGSIIKERDRETTMKHLRSLALLTLLALPCLARAQDSPPVKLDMGLKFNIGGESSCKGWFLYWPAEALAQPRMAMAYPFWPSQANQPIGPVAPNPLMPPPDKPTTLPSPLDLPTEPQSVPRLPGLQGVMWRPEAPYYHATQVQPVTYTGTAPAYWYGR